VAGGVKEGNMTDQSWEARTAGRLATSATIEARPDGFAVLGTVEYAGRTFTAGGGFLSDGYLYGYPNPDGTVSTWAEIIPGARIVRRTAYRQWNPFSRWHEPRVCYRIRLADGREYSGRNSGEGMLLKARRVGRRS